MDFLKTVFGNMFKSVWGSIKKFFGDILKRVKEFFEILQFILENWGVHEWIIVSAISLIVFMIGFGIGLIK